MTDLEARALEAAIRTYHGDIILPPNIDILHMRTAIAAYNAVMREAPQPGGEGDMGIGKIMTERDAAIAERDGLRHDCDYHLREHKAALAERDAAIAERDAAIEALRWRDELVGDVGPHPAAPDMERQP